MITNEELLQVADRAARQAGDVLRSWRDRFSVQHKSCAADLVTEADVAAQHVIHEIIQSRFPEHALLGEEGLSQAGNDYRWIIDPLDGTSNYVHGFPYYAVSIAVERAGVLQAGVVYDPNRDEMFSAMAGQGAHANGTPLRTSGSRTLGEAMLVASFPPGATRDSHPIQQFLAMLPKVQTIHRTGSAAMNLAYLAAGRLDGFWSSSLKPWDMAAGVLLVRESGGMATRMDGQELDLQIPDLLATNGTGLHAALRDELTRL